MNMIRRVRLGHIVACSQHASPFGCVHVSVLRVLPAAVLKLPGPPGRIGMDYLAYDPQTHQVWVPASNTGRTMVIDSSTRKISTVDGFPTVTKDNRTSGPTSATIGEGFVYVGNRADSSICPVEKKSLKLGSSLTLDSTPDGIPYLATT